MSNDDKLYEELRKQIRDVLDDEYLWPWTQEEKIMPLIKAHLEQKAKYQTYIYKQDHPRLEAEGMEIWGIRIAYQGQCIYGDIAGSEEKAYEMLKFELDRLNNQREQS